MKIISFLVIFLTCLGCKKENDNKSNTIKSKRVEFLPEPDNAERIKYFQNLNLNSFFENPINFQEFKKLKQTNFTSTVSNKKAYYVLPKANDSIFYTYSYPTKNLTEQVKKINQIVVFKSGKNKHSYNDSSEILIELRVFNNDSDLGEANLIGISKTDLESKFGTEYQVLGNKICYKRKNKVLIFSIEDSKVTSFNYINLNTENINLDLLKKNH